MSEDGHLLPFAKSRFQAAYRIRCRAPGARLQCMSRWNYRVVKDANGLRIFDVYYDDAGRPTSTHAAPAYVCGETLDDLNAQLQLMNDALTRPVLDEAEIGNGASPNARAG